jgi:hypothetical protein
MWEPGELICIGAMCSQKHGETENTLYRRTTKLTDTSLAISVIEGNEAC